MNIVVVVARRFIHKFSGANVGCCVKSCTKSFHIGCVIKVDAFNSLYYNPKPVQRQDCSAMTTRGLSTVAFILVLSSSTSLPQPYTPTPQPQPSQQKSLTTPNTPTLLPMSLRFRRKSSFGRKPAPSRGAHDRAAAAGVCGDDVCLCGDYAARGGCDSD